MGQHTGPTAWLLGRLYDWSMAGTEEACLAAWRQELLSDLHGSVLEIGAGTGANLSRYPDTVERLVACEPSLHMRRGLEGRAGSVDFEVVLSEAEAEDLPFEDDSFDHVVSTLVLCSVDDPARAAGELYRVLKPGGTLVVLEHVAAVDNPKRLAWQRRVEPVWKVVSCGCHVTRDTGQTLRDAGFELPDLVRQSMRKAPQFARPSIRGIGRKPGGAR